MNEKRMNKAERFRRIAGSMMWLLKESPAAAEARNYLETRNVSMGDLGWLPFDPSWFPAFLKGKDFTEAQIMATGLFKKTKEGIIAKWPGRIVRCNKDGFALAHKAFKSDPLAELPF